MTGIGHADAAGEIKQFAPVIGVDIRALGAFGNKVENATPGWSHVREIFFVKLTHYQFLIHSKRDRNKSCPLDKS
jgi:hypothetical protein